MILTFRRAYSRGDDKGSEILLGPFTIPEPKESDAAEPPIPGILGKPVGTELSVEGTFEGFDRNLLHVVKINGEKLSPAVIIQIGMPTGDLGPFARIPTNTVYKFNGKEMTYVVEALIDPKTGKDWQQAVSGRHFYFMVSEVLAPEGIKIRDQTKQTEANKETGPQPTNSHPVRP